jgi:hypothetical protein
VRGLTIGLTASIFTLGLFVGAWDDAALRSPRFDIAEAAEPAEREFIAPAVAAHEAERGERYQATPTAPPPTVPTGLFGLPLAPEGLTDCAEFAFYRSQFGMPERFDGIAWRESNCRNEDGVRTSCCHGYLQLYVSLHVRDHRLAPLYEACGVRSQDDVNSDTPIDKQRHLCAAAALYSVVGIDAWDATK